VIDLQHSLLYKHPNWFNTSDDIKTKIKKNIHLTLADIFKQLKQQNPNLTQKQVHDNDESSQIFEEYKLLLQDALKIVQEQENGNNIQ
ncbi:9047_t:CDS:2, partial [Dentiscutata erythropus]